VTWSAETHWHAFIESDEGFVPEVAKDAAIDCGAVGDPKILNTHQFWQQIWTKVPKAA
jgi:hypothetical protein